MTDPWLTSEGLDRPHALRLRAQHCAAHPVHTVASTAHYILTGEHRPAEHIEDDELHLLRVEAQQLRDEVARLRAGAAR